jgi:acetoin utilization protein AcuB
MTSKVITVGPRDSLSKAKALMDSGNFRHMPVVDDGKLIGILSDRDLRSQVGYLESPARGRCDDSQIGYH